MIVLIHNTKKVIDVITPNTSDITPINGTIGEVLFALAHKFPEETLAWCHQEYYKYFDKEAASALLHHDKMMLSFEPSNSNFLSNAIGYVDHASILIINKKVSFFTWQMSSSVGLVKSVLLNAVANQIPNKKESFDYLLQSLAKRAMPNGLFCYSEPRLLHSNPTINNINPTNNFTLFRFVKQHKSIKWLVILFVNMFIYERKIAFIPFIYALFFKSRKWDKKSLDNIEVNSKKKVVVTNEIDVIIPTIGRSQHVYNVLCDLRLQTHLPKKVIVVEQNPEPNSISQLEFLTKEIWPFIIDHTFTHQPGACNARNIALSKVSSEWVFMCDDDNRFENSLIKDVFDNIKKYGVEVLSTAYPQKKETIDYTKIHQTTIFGSGNSFLKSIYLRNSKFDATYEFCYGEDFDFGMQLRNLGADVVYFPKPHIVHLKAPMGGFRIKPIFKWSSDPIQPKPSPTILLNFIKYRSKEQVGAYKTIYFFKMWSKNKSQNPFTFASTIKRHWQSSLNWVTKINR